MQTRWTNDLKKLHPCRDAYEWALTQKSLKSAWANCERGDWMLWLAGKLCKTVRDRKRLVLAACPCARLALGYVTKGDGQPLATIRMAEEWAKGNLKITIEMVRDSADASYAAYAAYAAYASAAKFDMLKKCAEIVRVSYPNSPRLRR